MNNIEEIIIRLDKTQAVKVLNSSDAGSLSEKDMLKLSYIRLNSLTYQQVSELFKKSILVAFEIEQYDLFKELEDYLLRYDYVPDEIKLCADLKKILEESQELIGNNPFTISDKKIKPSISNFLKDYLNNSAKVVADRDALSVFQYINNSPNPKILTISNRQVLKSLIQIYDHLLSTLDLWESLPDRINQEDFEAAFSKQEIDQVIFGYSDDVYDFRKSEFEVEKQNQIDQKLQDLKKRQQVK